MATTTPELPLPRSVQQVANVIGREAALSLVGALPRCWAGVEGKKGERVICYVPRRENLHANHRLVRILGWETALTLCDEFGSMILQLATCAEILRAHRVQSIRELHRLAVPLEEIAVRLKCCKRTVINTLQETPQEAATTM